MRLIRAVVDAFQCIEHAEVELGPGLNVLFGPNDLGKSTLAHAVRSVLLLPHGSAAHEDLVSWHGGEPPRVALTFQTEPQRIWRVTKTFGAGSAGSSLLEFSKDGRSFSKDATARQVDARIRELLRWGIEPPGGKGGPRGLPETFLTNVLLAPQVDVLAVLREGLEKDPGGSGRDWLTEALQALGEDPLFKRVLERARREVDAAYTDRGAWKRSRGAPLQVVREEIAELRGRRSDLETRRNETLAAETQIRAANDALDALLVDVAAAEEEIATIRRALEQAAVRASAAERLRETEAARAALRAELARVDEAENRVLALREAAATAEAVLTERERAAEDARDAHQAARRRLEERASESAARARDLAIREADNERLRREARLSDLTQEIARAERALCEARDASAAEARAAAHAARLAEAESIVAQRAGAESIARAGLSGRVALEGFARLREAEGRRDEALGALAGAAEASERARLLEAEAVSAEREAATLDAPPADALRALESLAREIELAEARLGGGLSVAVTPLREVAVESTTDGDVVADRRGRDPFVLEAERSLELRVGDLLRITVTAGEKRARDEVERLRARWDAEAPRVDPALARATPDASAPAAARLATLAERRAAADERLGRSAELRAEAARLAERAAAQGGAAAALDAAERLVAERAQALAGEDLARLGASYAALGDASESALARTRSAAEAELHAATAALEEARRAAETARLEHASADAALALARRAADAAGAAFPEGAEVALAERRRARGEIEREIAEIVARRAALEGAAAAERGDTERALAEAEARLAAAEDELGRARAEREERRETLARADGEWNTLRAQAQRLDAAAADAAVEAAERALAELPRPEVEATGESLAAGERRLRDAHAAAAEKRSVTARAEGALGQVCGAVVREQFEEIERALHGAEQRERDLEVEYGAWRLLATTLREVERSEGVHLGRALAAPLGERFADLTGGRYQRLSLGQALELAEDCVEVAGQMRPATALSVGTQDQLATLFRLCLAEQITSAIVLDDHLAQSDPAKLDWFREQLRRAADRIQVVLLTCRPHDYLLPEERPEEGETVRDRAAGLVRAVDLRRSIRRYPLAAAAGTPGAGAR